MPVNQTTDLSKNKQTTISPLLCYTPDAAKSFSVRQSYLQLTRMLFYHSFGIHTLSLLVELVV